MFALVIAILISYAHAWMMRSTPSALLRPDMGRPTAILRFDGGRKLEKGIAGSAVVSQKINDVETELWSGYSYVDDGEYSRVSCSVF